MKRTFVISLWFMLIATLLFDILKQMREVSTLEAFGFNLLILFLLALGFTSGE